jgi:hypothetical protein
VVEVVAMEVVSADVVVVAGVVAGVVVVVVAVVVVVGVAATGEVMEVLVDVEVLRGFDERVHREKSTHILRQLSHTAVCTAPQTYLVDVDVDVLVEVEVEVDVLMC